jgi:hypothetical protein
MKIEIGTRVRTTNGEGIVFATHPYDNPSPVRSIGGIMISGGAACHDVVYSRGIISRRVPDAILLSSPNRVVEGSIATGTEIALALANADKAKAAKEAAESEAEKKFREEKARIIVENPHLVPADATAASCNFAAANLRKELKHAFPKTKFSVKLKKYSGGNSISASWTDGAAFDKVCEICQKYVGTSFDGMQDLSTLHVTAWNSVFGSANHVFPGREITAAALARHMREKGYDPSATEESVKAARQRWAHPSIINIVLREIRSVTIKDLEK